MKNLRKVKKLTKKLTKKFTIILATVIFTLALISWSLASLLGKTVQVAANTQSALLNPSPTPIYSKDFVDNLLTSGPPKKINDTTNRISLPFDPLSYKKFNPIFLPILMYHHIRDIDSSIDKLGQRLSVSPNSLEKTLETLQKNNYKSLSFSEVINYLQSSNPSIPSKSILIAFDDGYEDNYTNAMPLLSKYGYKGNFAIITGFVGKSSYMNWDEIKTLKSKGNDIVSHTVDHPDLSKLTNQKLIYELVQSKKTLDLELSQNTQIIVYPSGKYSLNVEQVASSLGYLLARTTEYGEYLKYDNLMQLPAIRMFDETDVKKYIKS